MSATIKLTSADGQSVEVAEAIARMSVTVKNMLDDIDAAEISNGIPLPNVQFAELTKVVEWCTHHQNDPAPAPDAKKSSHIEPWDEEFMKVEQAQIFKLILAANYLDIRPLLDLGCKTVANLIKGKTPEKILETFGIKNPITPEEEEQVKRENPWLVAAPTEEGATPAAPAATN